MDEVGTAVIAISLVLIAVFVPTAFIPGISGQFYLQFAITIAVSTAISAFNSLTLSPALAALLFKPHHTAAAPPRFFLARFGQALADGFNRGFDRLAHWYSSIVREPTKHPAKVTVPDIKLSISMADYPAWADSAKKWFVDGQHLEENEMQGSITFLGPDMTDEIGGIDLINCGFKKFSQDDFEADSEKIARFNVELYVEKMRFTLNYLDVRK